MTTQIVNANQVTKQAEPQIALPTRTLIVTMVVTALILAGLWSVGVIYGPWEGGSLQTGLVGIGIVAVISLGSLLILSPWKKRDISFWMTLWLGGTTFRFLLTPVVFLVLYSAASELFQPKSLALSVGLAYVITLIVEALVIASYVNKRLVV